MCVRAWYTSLGLGVGTGASVAYLSVSKPPNSVTRIALITRAIPQTEKSVESFHPNGLTSLIANNWQKRRNMRSHKDGIEKGD